MNNKRTSDYQVIGSVDQSKGGSIPFKLSPVQLHILAAAWPWHQTDVVLPWSLPLAAIGLPGTRKLQRPSAVGSLRANKALESDVNGSTEDTLRRGPLRRPRPKVELQKVAGALAAGVANKLSALKRHFRRHQQRVREHREARRAAKHVQKKRRKGDGHQLFHRKSKSGSAAAELISQAEAFERALDVRSAIRCYEEAARLMPHSCQHLARCSKAWSDATYLDEIQGKFREKLTEDMKREVNMKAIGYSKMALEADPGASMPHVAACVSMGRLALFSENKAKVKLAKEAREHAILAIEKEPMSDIAHHLMGRWHWEMAQLNVVVRTLIRLAFGTALPPGSHQDALESYRRATQLQPDRLIHRVELGRAYHKLGRMQEAFQELEAAIRLDVEDINAHLQKIDADELLRSLRRMAAKHKWEGGASSSEQGDIVAQQLQQEQGVEGLRLQLPRIRLPQLPKVELRNPFEQKVADETSANASGQDTGASR